MIRNRAYLDHNASAPLRPEVRDAVAAALELTGNASSVHAEGRQARRVVEEARDRVAALVGANPPDVIFTSGGTEANILALSPGWLVAGRPRRLFMTAIEHPSVLKGARFAAADIELLTVTGGGVIDVDAARRRIDHWLAATPDGAFMLSVMLANNEVGTLQPVTELAAFVHERGGLLHTDAVQAAGKIALSVPLLEADLITISAHKLGGPKGIGALILGRGGLANGRPLMRGGGQELGHRAGTENVPGIAGFGVAAEATARELGDMARIRGLRDRLEAETRRMASEAVIFAEGEERLGNTSSFAVAGMHAETLVIAMDLEGIAISAGSACSSGKVERSHVLDAMGVPKDLAASAIRVSLGWTTAMADIERFLAAWGAIYARFRQRAAAA